MRVLVVLLALAACSPEPEAPPIEATIAPAATVQAAEQAEPAAIIPEALIRNLYAEPAIPTDPAKIREYFAEPFVAALTPNADGELTVDFDYRIDGQDGAADGLTLVETAGGPDGGIVEARFTNLGQAKTVVWTVCRQPDGVLKIEEAVRSGPDGWRLRSLLGLPPASEGC